MTRQDRWIAARGDTREPAVADTRGRGYRALYSDSAKRARPAPRRPYRALGRVVHGRDRPPGDAPEPPFGAVPRTGPPGRACTRERRRRRLSDAVEVALRVIPDARFRMLVPLNVGVTDGHIEDGEPGTNLMFDEARYRSHAERSLPGLRLARPRAWMTHPAPPSPDGRCTRQRAPRSRYRAGGRGQGHGALIRVTSPRRDSCGDIEHGVIRTSRRRTTSGSVCAGRRTPDPGPSCRRAARWPAHR